MGSSGLNNPFLKVIIELELFEKNQIFELKSYTNTSTMYYLFSGSRSRYFRTVHIFEGTENSEPLYKLALFCTIWYHVSG